MFRFSVIVGLVISRLESGVDQPGAIEYKDINTSTVANFSPASVIDVLMLAELDATRG